MLDTKLNKTDYLLIAIYALILILLNAYEHTINYDTTKYIHPDGSITQNIAPSFKGYFVALPIEVLCTLSVALLLFLWIIPTFLIEHKNYFLFFSITIIITTLFGIVHFTIWRWAENRPWETYPGFFKAILQGISLSAQNAGMLLGVLLAKKYYESQLDIVQIQKKQQESELKLLQAQLNPHFLFNNLNTLDALIDKNSTKAKQYITNLSSLYRYLIDFKDEDIVPLEKEVEMIKHYFYLIETRFGEAYVFKIIKNASLETKYVPTGALQILIENVVKHNKLIDNTPIHTTIEIGPSEIIITNTKTTAKSDVTSFGTGLQNLKERYQLIFDETIVINDSEASFKITIPIITLTAYHK